MPKPYSQDLRDRVIDAVERGQMSRRAAARQYEISESVAINWLERVERMARESPSDTAAMPQYQPEECAAYIRNAGYA
ncbi:MAG TPA: IS630 transposase-related protein [Roseiarcus sp.]|nr:IS630 transposase-related protein [Roseiarcus sp.]